LALALQLTGLVAAWGAASYTETFDTSPAGWQDGDPVKLVFTNTAMVITNVTVGGNPGGCIVGTFALLGSPGSEIDVFMATGALASANFIGDYDAADGFLMGFDFMPQQTPPSSLQLRLSSGTNMIFSILESNRVAPFIVEAMALSDATNLYVGGDFTSAGEIPAHRIALWNGTTWTNLAEGLGGAVHALAATSPTNVYAAGEFTNAGSVAADRIAMWNGSAWTNLGDGLGGTVRALAATSPTNVWAAGEFTNAGALAANRIALWNGTSWASLGAGVDGTVWALAATAATNLYAGGDFTNSGGLAAAFVARWNGSAWSGMGSGMNTTVLALAALSTNVFAGGSFTNAGGGAARRTARWNGTVWTNMSEAGMNRTVRSLVAVTITNVYAGGDFSSPQTRIARWNGTSWANLVAAGCDDSVRSIVASSPTNLYAAGDFTKAGGSNVVRVARWNSAAWSSLSSGMASWSHIAISLRSVALGDWHGSTNEFANLMTNVDAVALLIGRNDTIAQSYRLDNFYIAPLPEATAHVAADETALVAWSSLRSNQLYRADAAATPEGPWTALRSFTATSSVHTVIDTNAATHQVYRLVIE